MSTLVGIAKIEFDPNLFNHYSVEQLKKKQAKLGFFKRADNTYVLSTTNCQPSVKLETNITKIAKLLQGQFLINLPTALPLENIFKTTQYLDSVSKIIERHNRVLPKPKTQAHNCKTPRED